MTNLYFFYLGQLNEYEGCKKGGLRQKYKNNKWILHKSLMNWEIIDTFTKTSK